MPNHETYLFLQNSQWSELSPLRCPCRGTGWMLSDYDTWHRCHAHGKGVPHPEDESDEAGAFDRDAHYLAVCRDAFATMRGIARKRLAEHAPMSNEDFTKACCEEHGGIPSNAHEWLVAAEKVLESVHNCLADDRVWH